MILTSPEKAMLYFMIQRSVRNNPPRDTMRAGKRTCLSIFGLCILHESNIFTPINITFVDTATNAKPGITKVSIAVAIVVSNIIFFMNYIFVCIITLIFDNSKVCGFF